VSKTEHEGLIFILLASSHTNSVAGPDPHQIERWDPHESDKLDPDPDLFAGNTAKWYGI
jgi:hypothetical protein